MPENTQTHSRPCPVVGILSDMSTGNVDDIEEERRLLYVAMTRKKDQPALIVPHRFYVHREHGQRW